MSLITVTEPHTPSMIEFGNPCTFLYSVFKQKCTDDQGMSLMKTPQYYIAKNDGRSIPADEMK